MFQFTRLALFRVTALLLPGSPIRVFVSQSLLATRHDFSQLSAPFFAIIRLGIRLTPFVALLILMCIFSCAIFKEPQWVWEDLNFRPHAYQACALTG